MTPWYEQDDCPDLSQPDDDYPATLSARVDALLARARRVTVGAWTYELPVTLDRAMLREWEEAEAAREVAS